MAHDGEGLNPSIWKLSLILAALGLANAAYLAYVKFTGVLVACGGIGNCDVVNNSRYSEVWGIPIALLGAAMFALIIALLILAKLNRSWQEIIYVAQVGLTLAGVLYSAYLTYIEIFVLQAICPYCVVSATLVTALLVLNILQFRKLDVQ